MTNQIFASTSGVAHGPTVVFIHSLGLDRTIWSTISDHLVGRCTVISCDLRGHGRSPHAESLTVEEMADDVAALLERFRRPPATIVGMSLGGCVAQALAIAHPERVAGLVLVDTTAWYGPDARTNWESRVERAQNGLAAMRDFSLGRWFSPGFLVADPAAVEATWEIYCRNDLPSYIAACRALGAVDLRPGLSSIAVPTTILVGSLDAATPVEFARELEEGIEGSRLEILEGAGHFSAIEKPLEVLSAIESVLAAIETR